MNATDLQPGDCFMVGWCWAQVYALEPLAESAELSEVRADRARVFVGPPLYVGAVHLLTPHAMRLGSVIVDLHRDVEFVPQTAYPPAGWMRSAVIDPATVVRPPIATPVAESFAAVAKALEGRLDVVP